MFLDRGLSVHRSRELHTHIRERIELALGGRSWSWLARTAGVPQSTLASQAAKPKFSVHVLLRVAAALERDVYCFLPKELLPEAEGTTAEDTIDRIVDLISKARRGDRP